MVTRKRLDIENWLRGEKITACIISLFFLLFYVFFQSSSVYGGDSGDLVTAAFVQGVAHPPGYPLYTFIASLLTKIPYSSVAWRVGLLSSIPAALTLGVFFLLLQRIHRWRLLNLVATMTFGMTY